MRKLIIHRQRALAAFALTYFVHVNKDREAHLQELSQMENPRMKASGDFGLRNGQTVAIPMEETGGNFFVGIYTQERNHVSPQISIAPGTEDVAFEIITDFDGNKRLAFRLVPAELPEA